MAKRILLTIYNENIALVDLSRYLGFDTDKFRGYIGRHKGEKSEGGLVLDYMAIKGYDTKKFHSKAYMSGVDINDEVQYLKFIVKMISEEYNNNQISKDIKRDLDIEVIKVSETYGIDSTTLKTYYNKQKEKAKECGIELTMTKAAIEIERKKRFMYHLENDTELYHDIIKSRIDKIYNDNHFKLSDRDIIKMIMQDRLCNIHLRKYIREQCLKYGLPERDVLTCITKYPKLSKEEIIQEYRRGRLNWRR